MRGATDDGDGKLKKWTIENMYKHVLYSAIVPVMPLQTSLHAATRFDHWITSFWLRLICRLNSSAEMQL